MSKKKKIDMHADDIHTLWHSFCNHLKKKYYILETQWHFKNKSMFKTKRKYKQLNFKKIIGYGAMKYIDSFIKKNKDIICVPCDDDYHASSSIYLIPHENKKEYWEQQFYLFHNAQKQITHSFCIQKI